MALDSYNFAMLMMIMMTVKGPKVEALYIVLIVRVNFC